jgi:CRISPR/Cas system-associated exonuclease Cas4 (RecB family)
MAKNFLQQVMLKKLETKQESFLDTQELIDKIQYGYIAKREAKFTTKKTFAPSTIAYSHGECPRYWYLAFEGAMFEDNADAYGVANRTGGNLSHGRIQDALLKSGVLAEDLEMDPEPRKYNKQTHPAMEFRVKIDDPPFDGYGDVMLDYKGERLVGEIKTLSSEGFEYRKINRRSKMGHLMQLLMYMKVWKIGKGVMIYENKNNHELVTLPVVVNDHYRNWVDQAFDWMRVVYKNWQDGQLPEVPYRSNSKICKVCPIKKACDEAEKGTIKIKPLVLLEDEQD